MLRLLWIGRMADAGVSTDHIRDVFAALGAAVQAGRFILLATDPDLQEESNRVDAAEAALDDTVAVDDPRVAQAAADRHAIEQALDSAFEDSGLAQGEDELFEAWDALHPDNADEGSDNADQDSDAPQDSGAAPESMSVAEAITKMPYDFSPARQRCMELALELAARE